MNTYQLNLVDQNNSSTGELWVTAPSKSALYFFISRKKLKLAEDPIIVNVGTIIGIVDGVDYVLDKDGNIISGKIKNRVSEQT